MKDLKMFISRYDYKSKAYYLYRYNNLSYCIKFSDGTLYRDFGSRFGRGTIDKALYSAGFVKVCNY